MNLNELKEQFKSISVADVDANLLPEDWYNVTVSSADWEKRKNQEMFDLVVAFTIDDGKYANRIKREKYCLLDESAGQRFTIAKSNFARLLKFTGVNEISEMDDVKLLEGKRLSIYIKHSNSTTTGMTFDNITGYR